MGAEAHRNDAIEQERRTACARKERVGAQRVSLSTLEGRVIVPMVYGEYQAQRLPFAKGQADLFIRLGRFFLATTIEIPVNTPIRPTGYLGVDLGIVNPATTSDGKVMTGDAVERVRRCHRALRAALQARGTKSARRHLTRLSGWERRFKRDTNHRISKQLVLLMKGTQRAIALENLHGLRLRITVRRQQCECHHKWAFGELRAFIDYKARAAGVPVILVDPRWTSRTCSRCHNAARANRWSRERFVCRRCHYEAPADLNAAMNIANQAAVNRPIVSTEFISDNQWTIVPRQG